jgi:hypothetical protein
LRAYQVISWFWFYNLLSNSTCTATTWEQYLGVTGADDGSDDARRVKDALSALPPLEPQLLGKASTAVQFSLFFGGAVHVAFS